MTTTYFKNLIMGAVFRTASGSLPGQMYLGLSSSTPNADGSGVTEPSRAGTGYVRVPLTSLSAPNAGAITNTESIRWPESIATWFGASAPATHYVIYDQESGGNLLMYNTLTKSRIIESNTVVTIKDSILHLQLTD